MHHWPRGPRTRTAGSRSLPWRWGAIRRVTAPTAPTNTTTCPGCQCMRRDGSAVPLVAMVSTWPRWCSRCSRAWLAGDSPMARRLPEEGGCNAVSSTRPALVLILPGWIAASRLLPLDQGLNPLSRARRQGGVAEASGLAQVQIEAPPPGQEHGLVLHLLQVLAPLSISRLRLRCLHVFLKLH